MSWSVEAFLDAYGFTRAAELDPLQRSALPGRPERVMAVLEDGTLIRDMEARQLPWGQVVAIRARDASGLSPCAWCSVLTEELYETGNGRVCEDCLDGAEPDE